MDITTWLKQYDHNNVTDTKTNPIILFDGVCNFCSASVKFVIKRDSKNRFRFCALQTPIAQKLLQQYGEQSSGLSSMILIWNNKVHKKSRAALTIARLLDGLWPLLWIFILVPPWLRDALYDFIGKRRYQWFGKLDACWVPDNSLKQRFLDHENTA